MWKKSSSNLISPKDKKLDKISIAEIEKTIIYENKDWLVFDKKPLILIHPVKNDWNELSMNDYLGRYIKENQITIEEWFTPSFWYRLDRDTSWVLIAAKTNKALQQLNTAIKDKEVSKEYFVIVNWEFPQYIKIDKPLEKNLDKKENEPYVRINHKNCF